MNAALATEDAHAGGYDDALLLTADGHVAEASAANIFAVFGREVATPPLVDDVLPGITRGAILEIARDAGYDVVERRIDRSELYLADEVFLTGTGPKWRRLRRSTTDRSVTRTSRLRSTSRLVTSPRSAAPTRGTRAGSRRFLKEPATMNLSAAELPDTEAALSVELVRHQRQRAIEPREPDPHRRWPPMARERGRQWSRRRAPPRRRQRARAAPRHGGGARVVRRPRGRHRARGEGVDLRRRSSQRRPRRSDLSRARRPRQRAQASVEAYVKAISALLTDEGVDIAAAVPSPGGTDRHETDPDHRPVPRTGSCRPTTAERTTGPDSSRTVSSEGRHVETHLRGRTALVTAASKGLGFAVARALASEDAGW